MRIAALQKTTLLDFPGTLSALIFTQGCNFHCPYCHNPALIPLKTKDTLLDPEDVLSFLHKRKNVLQGVVISGGEPSLQTGLMDFCKEVKALGYAIKLDTNGSNPQLLQSLLANALLDYVAMDSKSIPGSYPTSICPPQLRENIAHSIHILQNTPIPHEFRSTCVSPFITIDNFPALLAAIKGKAPLFLQEAQLENILQPDFFPSQGRALSKTECQALQKLAQSHGHTCELR